MIVLGVMTLAVFFLRYFVFTFHESPKFLLARGREAEAIEVLHKIAKFNKALPPTLTLEMFAAIDELDSQSSGSTTGVATGPQSAAVATKTALTGFKKEMKRLSGIFTNKLSCFIFILLAIAYMVSNILQHTLPHTNTAQGDYWSFNLAGAFLPIILLRNNVDSGTGTVKDTYQQYIIIYTPGILGAILALISVQMPLLGRKWSLVFSAICQGLSMAMYTQVKTTPGYVGLNALEYIMQTVRAIKSTLPRFPAGDADKETVLQRRPLRLRPRTLRHRVPRQRLRHAILHRAFGGHRRAVRRRAVPGRAELGDLVARCRGYLVVCVCHDFLAGGDAE